MPYLCIDRHNHKYYKPINPYCKGVRGNWRNVFLIGAGTLLREWEHFPIGLVYMVLFGKASGFFDFYAYFCVFLCIISYFYAFIFIFMHYYAFLLL